MKPLADRDQALVLGIRQVGQRFTDEPVVVRPKPLTILQIALAEAFGAHRALKPVTVRHERVHLRWMEPGPNGQLQPKYPNREGG